ncbi:hypothetical protein FQA39_LY18131 [Lamprigera yunnana]|nr:hypothetical protein FQA39_LY18131 [Lamprigera yunnana]
MSRSQKIVELARKQYTESNSQSMWMAPESHFDDQLENLEDDGDRYEVESDSCRFLSNTSEDMKRQSKLFYIESKRQKDTLGRIEKIKVNYIGSSENVSLIMNKHLSTPFDCAKHLGEIVANRSALAVVNGEIWHMHKPLPDSCNLELLHYNIATPTHVNKAFWRTCSFILGGVINNAFKNNITMQLHSFPSPNVRSGSFIYDAQLSLDNWTPTQAELKILSAEMVKFCQQAYQIRCLDVSIEVALSIFKNNEHKTKQIPNIAAANQGKVTLFRAGDNVDISKGPMVSNTNHLGRTTIASVFKLKTDILGSPIYRFQGVALPQSIVLNHVAYNIIEERAKKMVSNYVKDKIQSQCNQIKPPVWNPVYTVKGVLYIPYAELEEPFYAWYDFPSGQSRIDYYGGMVKTYQLRTSGTYGTSLKIAPVTTETQLNSKTCLQVNGSNEFTIEPQPVLPSLEGFNCVGAEVVEGILTEKWHLEQTIGQKLNRYTMWLKFREDNDKPQAKYAIPIRYEMKGFNSLLGSHYDHYYLTYEGYNTEEIEQEVFQVTEGLPCSAFPGPGDRHIYTFNPMKEFIHPTITSHVEFEFVKFKAKHSKQYTTVYEEAKRKEVFRQNIRFIYSVNRQHKGIFFLKLKIINYTSFLGYTLSVNHLADKTELELKALRGRKYSKGYNGGEEFPFKYVDPSKLPVEFDWRIYGAVTPVKDQSVCGSCWSFGTIGAVEGAFFLHNGHKLVRLSQQALIDCSWGFGNNGCDGGEDYRAYRWMLKHGGIPTEDDYGPYLGQDGYCHINNVVLTAKITGYVNVTSHSLTALRQAIVAKGPISVAIDAGHRTFSFYSNGVYYEPECKNKVDELDHAVLVVGYGTINEEDYWLIKNSWSNYWGNDGYILMSAKRNNCGVMTIPTYVKM